MHEPLGTGPLALRIRAILLRAIVLAVGIGLAGFGGPAAAQDAPPAPDAKAPAAKSKPDKATKSKSAGKKTKSAKSAKKGHAAKKSGTQALSAAAKAPPLPRREPFTLSERDRDIFAEAMKAVEARQWPRALETVARSNTPILKKIVTWAYIREPGNHVTFADRTAFIASNAGWPGLQTIERRAEEALDDQATVTVPTAIIDWFATHPPLTSSGRAANARALAAVGRADDAKAAAREAWRNGLFDHGNERAFLDQFGAALTPEDERERLDRLLYDENTVAADRQIARVDAATATVARARIALLTSAPNIEALIAAIPPAHLDDPGLVYDRVKWRRRQEKFDAARALLPDHPDRGPRPDLMWKERQYLARDALNAGLAREAYTIVTNHGDIDTTNGLADAEWLAGWIALRYLNDGEAALKHFEVVYDKVRVPANISKGAYWTGRAAEFLGRADVANDWYRRAATYVTTFYGELALSRLKDGPIPALSDDPVPSIEDQNAFEDNELTKATRALADVHDKTYLRIFVMALADSFGDATLRHLTAQLADRLGHPEWGVELSREAARDGLPLLQYGYPLPAYEVPTAPERAFILAITRQETNFDPNAKSVAGALGLMQLMPATAKSLARRGHIPYTQSKLTAEPAYNLRIGAMFLGSLVDNYDGCYVLAATAYNAGPGRVHQWVQQFGDPRDGRTDPVDWIEKIPFPETRAYVQRVMENLMVYRARLSHTRDIGPTLEAELVKAKPRS